MLFSYISKVFFMTLFFLRYVWALHIALFFIFKILTYFSQILQREPVSWQKISPLYQHWFGYSRTSRILSLVDTYLRISPVLSLDAASKDATSSKEAVSSGSKRLNCISHTSSKLSLRTSKDQPMHLRGLGGGATGCSDALRPARVVIIGHHIGTLL